MNHLTFSNCELHPPREGDVPPSPQKTNVPTSPCGAMTYGATVERRPPGAAIIEGAARIILLGALALLAVGVVFTLKSSKGSRSTPAAMSIGPAQEQVTAATEFPPLSTAVSPLSSSFPSAPGELSSSTQTAARLPFPHAPESNLTPPQLVEALGALTGSGGPITSEQADKFKQNLAALITQGAAAVPAIRAFLDKNIDSEYVGLAGGEQLGYSSLRAAFFDALKQIGGPEAQVAMLETLQTTALPSELLELAKDLDQQAPGAHREEILSATREALDMAAANQLGTNVEVGPLYRILQNYGGAGSADIEDIVKNDPSQLSSAIALGGLPDGQGLPSLVQLASQEAGTPDGSQTIATEMLGQVTARNPQAVDTLVQLAQQGQIPNNVWLKLAPLLAGEQYSPGSPEPSLSDLPPGQVKERIALLDKFIGVVPGDSAAAAALQHERGILSAKLGK